MSFICLSFSIWSLSPTDLSGLGNLTLTSSLQAPTVFFSVHIFDDCALLETNYNKQQFDVSKVKLIFF
jgi:hypothetical protein